MAASSLAAPPPPVPTPPALKEKIDGYDMYPVYQYWRRWVEMQKGPVTIAKLAEQEDIPGFKPKGTILTFTKHGDFGHYVSGEIRTYCRIDPDNRHGDLGGCYFVLRRAFVPLEAEGYNVQNPLSDWTKENFDPAALIRHFKDIGFTADTPWYDVDRDAVFTKSPSAYNVLMENAVTIRLDSKECPEMGEAIEALEGQMLDTKIDFYGVGTDQKRIVPGPHATTINYEINLQANGGFLSLHGSGGLVAELAHPILTIADVCENARNSAE